MAENLLRQPKPHPRPEQSARRNPPHHPPAVKPAVVTATPQLDNPVRFLSGVGPRRAEFFARVGVRTARQLLEYLPARYDVEQPRSIENLDEGMIATVIGRIESVREGFGRRGRSPRRLTAMLVDNTGRCSLKWFNASWMADRIARGMIVRATGRVGSYADKPQLLNPRIETLDDSAGPVDESAAPRLTPVYPATADLSSRQIADIVRANLDALVAQVGDWHPSDYLQKRGLPGRTWALRTLHRPNSESDAETARRRLCYDELLCLQLAVLLARQQRRSQRQAPPLKCTREIDEHIRRRLPFRLTPAQDRAVAEIVADLARPYPMHRLLQGDVGCGKTAVALFAALVAIANQHQAALMAPTEILARQHFENISGALADSRVRLGLLTGAVTGRARQKLIAEAQRGEIDFLVGTHALLEDQVAFRRLGVVIVDEQHRFGVRHRAAVRAKGPTAPISPRRVARGDPDSPTPSLPQSLNPSMPHPTSDIPHPTSQGPAPHYLLMTATPIPRTLTMTVYGDLDCSVIDALPPGRSPPTTRLLRPSQHAEGWSIVRRLIEKGQQVFIVYPLIDESDRVEARAATTEFRRLHEKVLAPHAVGLLHGRLKPDEREKVMKDFAAGRIAALVATTVIEVGIDVPNASCIVIEHPERFGLSQLHQLRGRVGRGSAAAVCLLMAADEASENNERLGALLKTTDGFRIAEEDLRLRGPGQLLGTRQHGLHPFQIADLSRDLAVLRLAQRDAADLIRADPALRSPANAALRERLRRQYQEAFDLLMTG